MFLAGGLPARSSGEGYIGIAAGAVNFHFLLLIFVVDSFGDDHSQFQQSGARRVPSVVSGIFEPIAATTTTDLVTLPVIKSRSGIKIHGTSKDRSGGEKKSYRV